MAQNSEATTCKWKRDEDQILKSKLFHKMSSILLFNPVAQDKSRLAAQGIRSRALSFKTFFTSNCGSRNLGSSSGQ